MSYRLSDIQVILLVVTTLGDMKYPVTLFDARTFEKIVRK